MKFAIDTLGCKLNQAETEELVRQLIGAGHQLVLRAEDADIYIVNTCTLTNTADAKSRHLLRMAHRRNPHALVVATGCYAETASDKLGQTGGGGLVVGKDEKAHLLKILEDGGYLGQSSAQIEEASSHRPGLRTRSFVKIQDGCNNSCSYCAIPKARGASKSIIPELIIEQINKAVSSGYNEIILTGIHLGTYGYDLKHKVILSYLLSSILKETRINRVRLSSLEVSEIEDDLLDLLTDERICNHLHIPLQSGDDKVLNLMKRQYDSRQFSLKIENISKKVPDLALGTDVIAGFPGEGDTEFQNTHKLLEVLPFTYIHAFPFSSRPNTIASEMPDYTPVSIKKERVQALNALNIRKKSDYMLSQVGKTLEILIEESLDNTLFSGISRNYLRILCSLDTHRCGSLIFVRVEKFKDGCLYGTPILSGK